MKQHIYDTIILPKEALSIRFHSFKITSSVDWWNMAAFVTVGNLEVKQFLPSDFVELPELSEDGNVVTELVLLTGFEKFGEFHENKLNFVVPVDYVAIYDK